MYSCSLLYISVSEIICSVQKINNVNALLLNNIAWQLLNHIKFISTVIGTPSELHLSSLFEPLQALLIVKFATSPQKPSPFSLCSEFPMQPENYYQPIRLYIQQYSEWWCIIVIQSKYNITTCFQVIPAYLIPPRKLSPVMTCDFFSIPQWLNWILPPWNSLATLWIWGTS